MKTRSAVIKECAKKLKQMQEQYHMSLERPTLYDKEGGEVIDMATREQHLHNSAFFRERFRILLPEIQNALARIADGTYGFCAISGEEIETNRLLAVPWTRVSKRALEQEAG